MKKAQLFSQSWSEVTSGERNEIVFERLNKTYGAYEIRTNYDNTLVKAFVGTVSLIALLSAVYFIARTIPDIILPVPYLPPIVITPPSAIQPVIPKTDPVTPPA